MGATLPAWLTAKVDQRMALVDQYVTPATLMLSGQLPLIVTPLAELDEHATEEARAQWERTCDCCGKHCPDPEKFFTGQVQRTTHGGVLVVMFFGVCQEHAHA
jgi:hypothetical protein